MWLAAAQQSAVDLYQPRTTPCGDPATADPKAGVLTAVLSSIASGDETGLLPTKVKKRDTGNHQVFVLKRFLLGDADPVYRRVARRLEVGQICPDKQLIVVSLATRANSARETGQSIVTNPQNSLYEKLCLRYVFREQKPM